MQQVLIIKKKLVICRQVSMAVNFPPQCQLPITSSAFRPTTCMSLAFCMYPSIFTSVTFSFFPSLVIRCPLFSLLSPPLHVPIPVQHFHCDPLGYLWILFAYIIYYFDYGSYLSLLPCPSTSAFISFVIIFGRVGGREVQREGGRDYSLFLPTFPNSPLPPNKCSKI